MHFKMLSLQSVALDNSPLGMGLFGTGDDLAHCFALLISCNHDLHWKRCWKIRMGGYM